MDSESSHSYALAFFRCRRNRKWDTGNLSIAIVNLEEREIVSQQRDIPLTARIRDLCLNLTISSSDHDLKRVPICLMLLRISWVECELRHLHIGLRRKAI